MVRSTSSCFKIIACSSDSIDGDDLERTESKSSTDKRAWSFRKRSTKHQVLSNNVTSETQSTGNKESPESTSIDFHAQSDSTVPAKISVSQTEVNLKVPDPLIASENACQINSSISTEISDKDDSLITTENENNIIHNLEESVAIVIQAAIRASLARSVLLKIKNVVKLQAAIRGHLVRRQAAGTLRCVQAIVKMQALVRARRARMSLPGSVIEEKLCGMQGKENSGTKAITEEWLSNGFARQLLESTTKGKRIYIKCDPPSPNSAWKWLERWMSVSSDFAQLQKPQFCPDYQEQEEILDTASEVRTEIPGEVFPESVDLNSTVRKTIMLPPHEFEENEITHDVDNFDFQECCPTSSTRVDMEKPQVEDVGFSIVQETDLSISPNLVSPDGTIDNASLGDINVKLEDINGESVESGVAENFLQVGQQPERSALDVQLEVDTPTDQETHRSSPEGSPTSHITACELHDTPPSQMSVKTKRNKLDQSVPTLNRKSKSADKSSPSNPNSDSDARSSTDQLSKDLKRGTRRNSFGSARTDQVDQEPPRDSNGNSLPSYMQATESARAKAHPNYSPRSNPDMQDKDIHLKKRHSLPGANGKVGSPRMQQQSTSQVQHGAKGNGTPTIEKKWQR